MPIDADGNVILVRQYRLPAKEALLEIPAGGVDKGESFEAAAQRELREETGYRAGRLERLGPASSSRPATARSSFTCSWRRTSWRTRWMAMKTRTSRWNIVVVGGSAPYRAGEIKDGKSIVGLLARVGARTTLRANRQR